MAYEHSDLELLHELRSESESIRQLLSSKGAFEEAFKAFRADDPKSFHSVLDRASLRIWCQRVCHWIRVKECVFLCLDLAGPPTHFERPPDPRQLAVALARVAADEKLVKKLADILVKRDAKGFLDIVKRLEIQPFAHFFCHWLCTIRYRLVCRWICTPVPERPPVLWQEIHAAALAIGKLAEDSPTFKAVAAASAAGEAAKLADLLRHPDRVWWCHYVCEYFCSWRCVLVCLTYARPFPYAAIKATEQIREARGFAEAITKLSEGRDVLQQLAEAVGSGKADRWTALVKEYKLERYAIQLCHWVCGWRCRLFCRLVCPEPKNYPRFDAIGNFLIDGDIDPVTGLTNKSFLGQGGPKFGFFNSLSLHASCPEFDPFNPAERMSYRFLFQRQGDLAPQPITGPFVAEVLLGSRQVLWNSQVRTQKIVISGAGATPLPTPTSGPPGSSPPDHVLAPDPQGWIEVNAVPSDSEFNGYLMGFDSAKAVPPGPTAPGVSAGTAVPLANQKNGTDCTIIFEAMRTSQKNVTPPDYSDSVKIRINNWEQVDLLELLQFHTGSGTPCSPLSNALDIEYTVDHELIGTWKVDLETAAGMSLTGAPPPPQTARGGAGTHHENIAAWPTCSYTVTLTTVRKLTTGLDDDDGRTQRKTFCIGKRNPN